MTPISRISIPSDGHMTSRLLVGEPNLTDITQAFLLRPFELVIGPWVYPNPLYFVHPNRAIVI